MLHHIAQLAIAQPSLPISHQPKRTQGEGGTAQIKVNPTQLSHQMGHPVQCFSNIPNPIFCLLDVMSMSMTQGKKSDLAGVESLHGRLEGREDTHRLDHVTLLRPERRHLIVQLQYAVDDLNQVHGSLVLVVPRVLGDEFNAVVNVQNTL